MFFLEIKWQAARNKLSVQLLDKEGEISSENLCSNGGGLFKAHMDRIQLGMQP